MRGHDLDQTAQHGAAVNAEIEREHHLHRQQLAEGGIGHQPVQGRIGGEQRKRRDREQHRAPRADSAPAQRVAELNASQSGRSAPSLEDAAAKGPAPAAIAGVMRSD